MKAPVEDQLVLKNHRREQSANATAGSRVNRNTDWGDVKDERRVESYERAPLGEEYEIVASKIGEDRNKRGRDNQAGVPQRS